PFRLADAKKGTMEIPVPQPAGLDVQFDSASNATEDALFKGALLEIWRRIPDTTGSYLVVATKDTTSAADDLRLADLAPGPYRISVRTHPKQDGKDAPGTEINLGAFHDIKELTIQAAQSEPVRFRYQPFDPNAFR